MAFESAIIEVVNQRVNKALQVKSLQPVVIHGLSTTIVKREGGKDYVCPAVEVNGRIEAIVPNTKKTLVLYTRHQQNAYDRAAKSFGSSHYVKQDTDFEIIAILLRKSTINVREVEQMILNAIPQRLGNEARRELKIEKLLILPKGSNFNELSIARQEFINYEPPLAAHTFFSIKYRAALEYNPACVENCTCQ